MRIFSRKYFKRIKYKLASFINAGRNSYELECSTYYKNLLQEERYQDPLRLNKFGFTVYSQYDEDGIIQEIIKRIGLEPGHFLEFGAENGNENNTAFLLMKDWSGLWLEANRKYLKNIETNCRHYIDAGKLTVQQQFVNAENIDGIIRQYPQHDSINILSIDIDSNDYWVWKAISCISPAIVVIEYNPAIPPSESFTIEYSPQRTWNGSTYQGAGLKALENLGKEKGYSLVGCSIGGANAFFVRDDLVDNHFLAPFTAEEHFEPDRAFLKITPHHPRQFGHWIEI